LFINAGCENPALPPESPAKTGDGFDGLSFYTRYAPVKIDIVPLTEYISVGDTQQAKIDIYVSLLDQYGSQIKSPGMFRFELYEHVQRSAEPRGKRVVIWADVDLTDPVTNNKHWRDFLRAYEFTLPFEQAGSQDYILQVTCLCPNGSRLSSEFTLKHPE
jgi:hypothetical protein